MNFWGTLLYVWKLTHNCLHYLIGIMGDLWALLLNMNNGWTLGWGQTDRHTCRQTHKYHDLAWPRGRAEWKKGQYVSSHDSFRQLQTVKTVAYCQDCKDSPKLSRQLQTVKTVAHFQDSCRLSGQLSWLLIQLKTVADHCNTGMSVINFFNAKWVTP